MRIHPRLHLATPTTAKLPTSTPPALLPPIPLYRRLLRAHRHKLPKEMRVLGDLYVKSEFRAHKGVENPVHIVRLQPQVHLRWMLIYWGNADRILDRVADVRAEIGGGCLEGGEAG
jgi:hypothetical protein